MFPAWLAILLAQLSWSLRAESVLASTLPRLQEHRLAALSGAGQNGMGSEAVGQTAKYC